MSKGGQFTIPSTTEGDTITKAWWDARVDAIIPKCDTEYLGNAISNVSEMQAVVDPYPSGVASVPTTARQLLQQMCYVINQLGKQTYWYEDPTFSQNYATLFEDADKGTASITTTGVTWNDRPLNSIGFNNITSLSLSSGSFLIPNGEYLVDATFLTYQASICKCRLYNVTDAADVVGSDTTMQGMSGFNQYQQNIPLHYLKQFTVSGASPTKEYKFQTYSGVGVAHGGGYRSDITGYREIFGQVLLLQLT